MSIWSKLVLPFLFNPTLFRTQNAALIIFNISESFSEDWLIPPVFSPGVIILNIVAAPKVKTWSSLFQVLCARDKTGNNFFSNCKVKNKQTKKGEGRILDRDLCIINCVLSRLWTLSCLRKQFNTYNSYNLTQRGTPNMFPTPSPCNISLHVRYSWRVIALCRLSRFLSYAQTGKFSASSKQSLLECNL